ncbi:hypothetical protein ABL78_7024 [Leptomonas seymouri]|uniref:Uncharacterized protein n=1 Tax=Leptomonas seymouri TaxID=5684 RepID=A0A0N1IHM1_LEPSE|nr:hypothetical protein ABL78_7024 [Leptomonas seymouri]|eukprot:KPI83924.1 hypothetical protein ABL78_7024 [Leptomonas seymouri]
MSSPVDLALPAYAPVPPPPISGSGSRPFQRVTVVSAEPGARGGLTVTTGPTLGGPSPSWFSVSESAEGLGTPVQSLQLSAPYSPSLEVTVQPPPMPPIGGGGPSLGSLTGGALETTFPFQPLSGRNTLKALKSAHATAAQRKLSSGPAFTFSASPLTLGRVGSEGSGMAAVLHRSNKKESSLVRSDSLPLGSNGVAAAAVDAVSPSPPHSCCVANRGPSSSLSSSVSPPSKTKVAAAACTRASTGIAHLYQDQQPALPQRIHQTPLAFFVDCVPSPTNVALMPHAAGFSESGYGVLSSSFSL